MHGHEGGGGTGAESSQEMPARANNIVMVSIFHAHVLHGVVHFLRQSICHKDSPLHWWKWDSVKVGSWGGSNLMCKKPSHFSHLGGWRKGSTSNLTFFGAHDQLKCESWGYKVATFSPHITFTGLKNVRFQIWGYKVTALTWHLTSYIGHQTFF